MENKASPTTEEYVEAIYKLEKSGSAAKTSSLAEQLHVTLGTITNTVENLEKEGLIVHQPYRGVKLTDKGRKLALSVIRRHRLSERLLTDFIRMNWSEAHETACKLEHSFTGDLTEPLEKALGHPKTCPHGNPIPTGFGGISEEKSEPLTNLDPKESGAIVKITEEKQEILRYLDSLGLKPGVRVKIEEKAPFGGPITVRVKETRVPLGHNVASIINVKKA